LSFISDHNNNSYSAEVIPIPEEKPRGKIYAAFFKQDFPADLALVVVWLVASIAAIYLPVLNETPIRIVLALPVFLFIPGYCIIAAFFPKDGDISLIERIAFSFGLSIAIVPLIGFGLNFTPWGIQLDSLMILLTLFIYVMILVAYYQRALLPVKEQFRIPFSIIVDGIREEFLPQQGVSRVNVLLSVVLCLVILIAAITTIYVLVVAPPLEGDRFSEFYILGENRTVANYPDQIIPGQNYPMYIGVGNQENRDMAYTIETWLLRTEFDNVTNTSHIIAMDPNDHLSFILAHNETTIIPYNLSLKKTGYDRVEFLLFNDSVPGLEVTGSDRINASYRDLHLWVTVGEAENEDQTG
jgi:uncharacterized membrane protein